MRHLHVSSRVMHDDISGTSHGKSGTKQAGRKKRQKTTHSA